MLAAKALKLASFEAEKKVFVADSFFTVRTEFIDLVCYDR